MSLTETKDVTTPDGQTRQLAGKPHALRTTTTLAVPDVLT